jgi:hypothetical protein
MMFAIEFCQVDAALRSILCEHAIVSFAGALAIACWYIVQVCTTAGAYAQTEQSCGQSRGAAMAYVARACRLP